VTRRSLTSPPGLAALYARSALAMVPNASLLPFVPGGGGEVPDLELELADVRSDRERVAAYARVCGFAPGAKLPPTYPHVLAFPMHMAVMANGRFPFGAVGLVHVENRILQRRPIAVEEPLDLRVRVTPLERHRRGRTFTLVTEARAGGQVVWESVSTMLRRGGGHDSAPPDSRGSQGGRDSAPPDGRASQGGGDAAVSDSAAADPDAGAGVIDTWTLDGALGRRYAAVSGDRNPIHMHALSAKLFGFPGAIAHGMWTKARALAAIESRLPEFLGVEVQFRKPIVLPARIELTSHDTQAGIELAVRDAKRHTPHLDGRVWRLGEEPAAERQAATTGGQSQ
jgi:acyl dehydratase